MVVKGRCCSTCAQPRKGRPGSLVPVVVGGRHRDGLKTLWVTEDEERKDRAICLRKEKRRVRPR